MAIDTANKRAAVLINEWYSVLPLPSGINLSLADRIQLAGIWPGLIIHSPGIGLFSGQRSIFEITELYLNEELRYRVVD